MTKKEFQIELKRLFKRWNQYAIKFDYGKGSEKHLESIRQEFINFIDEAKKTDWFIMPNIGTRIHTLYYNKF